MNNKRQTIWLVSMLSLMVILSAYYLFTEDVTPAQNANQGTEQTDLSGAAKASGDKTQGVQVTEVDPATDSLTDPGADGKTDKSAAGEGGTSADGKTDGKTGAKTDETASGGALSPDDEAVLKGIANLKGAQFFDEHQRLRKENYDRKWEELNVIVADTKNHTQEQASSAVEEMTRLEDTDNRMTSLEEKLLQDYENAVVTEEETNFKVVVQTAKLEKKQAVKIIDLASKELNVTPDRLSVQYVP